MPGNILQTTRRVFTRMRVASALILAALLLAALGSLFPQRPAGLGPRALAEWDALIRARYGPIAGLLDALGAFHLSSAPLVWIAGALLAIATLACTLNRWRAVWRGAFQQPIRGPDAVPHSATLQAVPGVDYAQSIREGLRRRRFRVRTEKVGDALYMRGDRNRLAPFGTLVTHSALLLLLAGALVSGAFAWRDELTLDPGQAVEVGHGNGLAVRQQGLTIQLDADGNTLDYRVELTILRDGRQVAGGTLRLNHPVTHRGVGFYLMSYRASADGHSVTLLAVRDPGYRLVLGAGFVLLLGLVVTFYFPHAWLCAHPSPEGALSLAGGASRQAAGFGREFAAWVATLSGTNEEGAS